MTTVQVPTRAFSTRCELRPLASVLRDRTDHIVDAQLRLVRRTRPIYGVREVPTESLKRAARANTDRALTSLLRGHAPESGEVNEVWIADERLRQGIQVPDMLDGYRTKQRAIREVFSEVAASHGASQAAISEGLRLLVDTADVCAHALLTAATTAGAIHGTLPTQFDGAMVLSMLEGDLTARALREALTTLNLREDAEYYAVRGRPHLGNDPVRLRNEIQSQTWVAGRSALIFDVDGEVFGVVARRPAGMENGVVAIGPAALISDIAQSYTSATRVLASALQFGWSGVCSQADLGLRLAIVSNSDVANQLAQRYFEPLSQEGDFGRVLEHSVIAYVDEGGEVKRAARTLDVHPNTLKYRLHRFESLAGVDLSDPRTVAELWWVVEAAKIGHVCTSK